MAIWSAMFWKLQVADSQCHAEGSQCESVLALATASASATDRPPWPVVKAMDGRGAHPQSRNPIPGATARVSATRDHFSYRFCVLCRRFEADAPEQDNKLKIAVLVGTLHRIISNSADPAFLARPLLLTAYEYCELLRFPVGVAQSAFARVAERRQCEVMRRVGLSLPQLMPLAVALASAPEGEQGGDRARLAPSLLSGLT